MRVRVCQSYFARPGRPSGRRRAGLHLVHRKSLSVPGPVSVRMCPAVHGVCHAGVVPASQPGWSRGLCQGLSFNDRLMDVPSGNLGCIEKCKSDMGCGLVCKVCLTSVS